MKFKTLWIIFFMMSVAMLVVSPVLAQADLDETYTSEDGTFQISFPENWTVDDSDSSFIVLSGVINREQIAMTVFSTETVALFSVGESSAVDVALNVSEAVEFVQDDVDKFPIGERDGALASVELEGQTGVAFVVEMDNGEYGMVVVLASTDVLTENVDFVLSIIETYNTPEDGGGELVQTLTNYDGEWQDAIEELQDMGLIGTGGNLVFQEDRAFFTGQGFFFTPLGRHSPYTDVVMAGEIEFTSGSTTEYEECSLLARVVDTGGQDVTTYMQVGVDNDGNVFFLDTEGTDDTFIYDGVVANLDLSASHHVLFILADETVTVYLNGEIIINKAEINEERAGTYGIALMGRDRESRCEGSNIWVYQVPSFEPGVCEVSAGGTVNKRSGPGTDFDRAGTLEAGIVLQAVGYTDASDGFRWWELEDETWVREDIVNVAGDCANVPESE